MTDDKTIGERIRSCRKKVGLTQKALADKMNIHISRISRYESGKSTPTQETIKLIAEKLNVRLEYLLGQSSAEDGATAFLENFLHVFDTVTTSNNIRKNLPKANPLQEDNLPFDDNCIILEGAKRNFDFIKKIARYGNMDKQSSEYDALIQKAIKAYNENTEEKIKEKYVLIPANSISSIINDAIEKKRYLTSLFKSWEMNEPNIEEALPSKEQIQKTKKNNIAK